MHQISSEKSLVRSSCEKAVFGSVVARKGMARLLLILWGLIATPAALASEASRWLVASTYQGEQTPALTLKMPATEPWQNWCDDGQDELAEYDIYHFCRSYSPTLVLEDRFSQKLLQNVKAGTLELLERTKLIGLVRWTGVEQKLQSDQVAIPSGLSLEFEPGLEDAYIHLRYHFQ